MYNINKRRTGMDIKVKDIIAELEKENPEAIFTCCGDNLVFVHVEQDNSVVTIDTEDLHDDEGYEDAMDGDINDIPAIEGQKGYYISRQRFWELLHILINNIYEPDEQEVMREALMEMGYTKEELDYLCYFKKQEIELYPKENEVNNEVKEKAIAILDSFENLLEEKDITIPSDDREGEESEARLFGSEYYNLEDEIINIISDHKPVVEEKPKARCPIFFENQETEVKMEMQMTVESKEKAEDLKVLEHHIDRLLDLDSYPEIKTVHDVKVEIIK